MKACLTSRPRPAPARPMASRARVFPDPFDMPILSPQVRGILNRKKHSFFLTQTARTANLTTQMKQGIKQSVPNFWYIAFTQSTSLRSQILFLRYHLKDADAVLDGGIPFNKAYGMTTFEYHGTGPRFNKVFNRAMSDRSLDLDREEDPWYLQGIWRRQGASRRRHRSHCQSHCVHPGYQFWVE